MNKDYSIAGPKKLLAESSTPVARGKVVDEAHGIPLEWDGRTTGGHTGEALPGALSGDKGSQLLRSIL